MGAVWQETVIKRRGNQVALFNVLRACYYLHRFTTAYVYLANLQMVTVFVGCYFFDFTDNNILEAIAGSFNGLNLEPCHNHLFAKNFGLNIYIHIIF